MADIEKIRSAYPERAWCTSIRARATASTATIARATSATMRALAFGRSLDFLREQMT